MLRDTFPTRRSRLLAAVAVACGVLFPAIVTAAPPEGTVRVEEDWEVVISEPDPDGDAPQIITAMSSTDRLADVHALFEMNHGSLPEYKSGGLQLQMWSGDTNLDYRTSEVVGTLKNANETVRYTLVMKIEGGVISFDVVNGTSSTWSNFGSNLYVSQPTEQTGFPKYNPEVSKAASRVGYAGHRVEKFSMKEVRYYDASGNLLATDTTERVVHDKDDIN